MKSPAGPAPARTGRVGAGEETLRGAPHQAVPVSFAQDGDGTFLKRTIVVGPTAAAEARGALAGLADALGVSVFSQAQLLVSSLVTQRVLLAPEDGLPTLRLEVSLTRSRLRLSVTDEKCRALPHPHGHSVDWELQLVAELSDRWGMRHDGRTTLWSELDL